MIITKEQAKLIADLAGQIQEKYGIVIGYSNPTLPVPASKDADFIIFESPALEDLHCFYKDDIQIKPLGQHMVRVLPAEPEFDDEVQGLIDRLNNDLLEGKIWFDPVATRVEDGLEVTVTKKKFPGTNEDIFETNIRTDTFGSIYTYAYIAEHARTDKRFKIAKDLIDENWPREPITEEEELPQSKVNDILSQLFRLFGF